MRIVVCDVTTSVRYRTVEVESPDVDRLTPGRILLYVHVSRLVSPAAMPDLLHKGIPSTLKRRIDRTVLQAHPETAAAIESSQFLIDDICARLEVPEIELLTSKGEIQLTSLAKTPRLRSPVEDAETIEALRTADFLTMAERAGARLPDTTEFHYEGPNGNHYTSFLRPGFSMSSLEDLEAICFWLAPLVPSDAVIVVDTWNLAALGLALENYSRLARGSREPGSSIPFACAESYKADPTILADYVRAIATTAGVNSVFFLVSISGSGNFAATHYDALAATGLDPVVVALFATEPERLPSTIRVMQTVTDIQRFEAASCERCLTEANKSPVIRVLPKSYLLELSGAVELARVRRETATNLRVFFEEVGASGGLSVHKDQHDGLRHHGIHIDVERLLESDGFRRRCKEMVVRLARSRIDAIVCPDHPAATALAVFMAEAGLNCPVFPVEEHQLARAVASTPQLQELQRLLIVDDVAITGHRMSGYQRALHDSALVAHKDGVDLWYAVGVARPPSESLMIGLKNMVPKGHFMAAAEFLLPEWQDEPDCPWCLELGVFDAHPEIVARHPSLRARHDLSPGATGSRTFFFTGDRTQSHQPGRQPGRLPKESGHDGRNGFGTPSPGASWISALGFGSGIRLRQGGRSRTIRDRCRRRARSPERGGPPL